MPGDEAGAERFLVPSPARLLSGEERFVGLDASVADFWRWAFSDLRDNVTRGILAEYLVVRTVGDERGIRVGWDNWDAALSDGTTIEVKCSAYLQSWSLKEHSKLSFGRLITRAFDATRNELAAEPAVRADVFCFCVQTQLDPAVYDMLDLAYWEFWVCGADVVRAQGNKTAGIAWVKRHAAGPFPYSKVAAAIRAAAPAKKRRGDVRP